MNYFIAVCVTFMILAITVPAPIIVYRDFKEGKGTLFLVAWASFMFPLCFIGWACLVQLWTGLLT